jgi:hypothetical protein
MYENSHIIIYGYIGMHLHSFHFGLTVKGETPENLADNYLNFHLTLVDVGMGKCHGN